ncbi:hypothetical protein C8R44DRAFT_724883 [Mycena epipterygia]|nr:hypothetical protein C8R44DRAFT_724883 [Mycena epipterygia]
MKQYPSVWDSENGSIAVLNKVMKKIEDENIMITDEDELMALVRPMQTEVQKMIPNQLTNKMAIEKFMGKLAPEFTHRIWTHLDMEEVARNIIPIDSVNAVAVAAGAARLESQEKDKYLFKDVVEVARNLSYDYAERSHHNSGGSQTSAAGRSSEQLMKPAVSPDLDRQQTAMLKEFEEQLEERMTKILTEGSTGKRNC